jgi:hypothetical protein
MDAFGCNRSFLPGETLFCVEWCDNSASILRYEVVSFDGMSLRIDDGAYVGCVHGNARLALFSRDKGGAVKAALVALAVSSTTNSINYRDQLERGKELGRLVRELDDSSDGLLQ